MSRPDWNCPFSEKSLIYRHRNQHFEIGDWLRCQNCFRLTQFGKYWEPRGREQIYSMSLQLKGLIVSFPSNASGAVWVDFCPMPKNDEEELLIKFLLEKKLKELELQAN